MAVGVHVVCVVGSSNMMTVPLETCTIEAQQVVTRSLGIEGERPTNIYQKIKMKYGYSCVLLQQVYEWPRKFQSGGSTLSDAICSS